MSHPTELPPLRPPTAEALRSRSHVVPDDVVMSRRRRQQPRRPAQAAPASPRRRPRPLSSSSSSSAQRRASQEQTQQQQQLRQQQQQPDMQQESARLAWAQQSQQDMIARHRQARQERGHQRQPKGDEEEAGAADMQGESHSDEESLHSTRHDADAEGWGSGDGDTQQASHQRNERPRHFSDAAAAASFSDSSRLLQDVLLANVGIKPSKPLTQSVDEELAAVHAEAKLLDACLKEIVKQVVTKDSSQAHYLTRVQQRYDAIFKRLPTATDMLKQEIATLSKINDHIAKTLQTFQQKVHDAAQGVAASRQTVKDIASKHFEATQVDHPEDYVQTPQDVAHELKDLYELQRMRLSTKADKIAEERDAWCKAAFDLASAMVDSKDLLLLQKLRLHQSTWHTLGLKFTLRLKDDSTRAVRNLKNAETVWKKEMSMLYRKLQQDDNALLTVVKEMEEGLDGISLALEAVAVGRMTQERVVERAVQTLRDWERSLSDVLDTFVGIRLEDLQQRDKAVDSAMEKCVQTVQVLYKCFPPLQTKHGHKLKAINEDVSSLVGTIEERVGVNSGFVNALSYLRNDAENTLGVLNGNKATTEEKLQQLSDVASTWRLKLDAAREHLVRPYVIKPILSQASDWVLAISMDTMAQCNRLIDEVADSQRSMTRWFITVQKLICGLDETTVTTVAEHADDVISRIRHTSKAVISACQPMSTATTSSSSQQKQQQQQQQYEGLEGVDYECKQWGVQVMVVLSRLRLDMKEGIDIEAVFRRNLDVKEAQDAWNALEGHAMVTVDENGTLIIKDLPNYDEMK